MSVVGLPVAVSVVVAAVKTLFSTRSILAKGICKTVGGFEPGQHDGFQSGGQGGGEDPVPNKIKR